MTSCTPPLAPQPRSVATSHAVKAPPKGYKPVPEPRSGLASALGAVLRRRFEDGHAQGSKTEFGHLLRENPLRPLSDASASVKASKMLAGQLPWPELQWEAVAEFVGLTPSQLLRRVATEMKRLESEGE